MKKPEAYIEIIEPGFYGSIQDTGRFSYRQFGVPVSGAMDEISYKLANHLLQNKPEAACIEITMTGGTFKFNTETHIVICGAVAAMSVNKKTFNINEIIHIHPGDILKIGNFKVGYRAYLAIAGGFDTELIFDSRSWYKGITKHFKLQKGIMLPYEKSHKRYMRRRAHVSADTSRLKFQEIKVFEGPEIAVLSDEAIKMLRTKEFSLSTRQSRMGIFLEEKLKVKAQEEIMTVPVFPGTIQLTPDGSMIILMRDAQVSGGYPRILQLSMEAISILAQKQPGDNIKFNFSKR